jgi:hypothetical protein
MLISMAEVDGEEEGGRRASTHILMQMTTHSGDASKEKISILLHGYNGVSALN